MKNKAIVFVKNYKTKSKYGFNHNEIREVLDKFPEINEDKFYNALKGITYSHGVTYHCDIINATRCGIENRDLNIFEWD